MAFRRSRANCIRIGALVAGLFSVAATASATPPDIKQERVPVQNATVDLHVQKAPAEKIEVLAREGSKLEPLPNAVKAESGALPNVSIPQGTSVVIRKTGPASTKAEPLPSQEKAADSVLVENVPVPGNEALREIRQWTLVLVASRTPLVWNAKEQGYTTELLVQLKELGTTTGSKPSSAISVKLVGEDVDIIPQTLVLSDVGVPGMQSAMVKLGDHRTLGTAVALSDFGEQKFEVKAGPQLSTLELSSTNPTIPGFGMGTTTITAVRRAEDGLELASASPLVFDVHTTRGNVQPTRFSIDAGKDSATIELRSNWLGTAELTAKVGRVSAQPVRIQFTPPWSYFAAILLGSFLGAFIRVRPKTQAQRYEFLSAAGVGVVLGLASFALTTAAFNLPATTIVTELGCFIVAAGMAYCGRAALDRFVGKPAEKPS